MTNKEKGPKRFAVRNPYGRKLLRILFALLAVCSASKLLEYMLLGLIALVLSDQNYGISEAASVGIIGGADGPTAIFVTASAVPGLQIVWLILLLLVGILGFSRCKHK